MEMYREIAEQKAEKEARAKEMQPRERDYAKEHAESVSSIRAAEAEGKIRQTNQAKLDYTIESESKADVVIVDIGVPRYLDSSLIDLDVHPTYISVVVKGKTLRLHLPEEVKPDEGKANRSKTTGRLVVTLPKIKPDENIASRAQDRRTKERASVNDAAKATRPNLRRHKLGDQVLDAVAGSPLEESKAVSIKGIVHQFAGRLDEGPQMKEIVSSKNISESVPNCDGTSVCTTDNVRDTSMVASSFVDDDSVPPLI